MFRFRALAAALLFGTLTLTIAVQAQSLADVAKKTEQDRPKDKKAPSKVYTNADLEGDTTGPIEPVTTLPVPETAPATKTTNARIGSTKSGPTSAQLHDLEATQQRVTLKGLQNSYHSAERALKQARESYSNMCPTLHLQVTDHCEALQTSIEITLPRAMRDVRRDIVKLAVALKISSTEALK